VAINDPHPSEISAHLLRYDSNYGVFPHGITYDEKNLIVDGKPLRSFNERDPKNIHWKDLGVDIVIEATGVFRTREQAAWHLESGAKKVIVTAPPKGDVDVMMVIGVNEEMYDPKKHHVISNASCTTNSLAPLVKVLHQSFGIIRGFMTTVHSFTNDQVTLDAHHSDLRRARTASQSIIPTTTGAAEAVGKVIPELKGKLTGISLRVPTTTVSVTDFVAELKKKVTKEQIHEVLLQASNGPLKGILSVNFEPLVSIDYKGSSYSSIIDALSTLVIDGDFVKLLAWYDNEWGYCCRLVDLCRYIGKSLN
jgi:glyceraldehyde-3-phosphate dehydrogenase type I